MDAESELSVVFEERAGPGGALAVLLTRNVGDESGVATPDAGAAGSVGDDHLVALELRRQLGLRRLSAARTRA